MKIKTTKRIAKKIFNREFFLDKDNIKLLDENLKLDLQEELKLISLFIRKRYIKEWTNNQGITYSLRYKFVNDVEDFQFQIRWNIGFFIRYYYNHSLNTK